MRISKILCDMCMTETGGNYRTVRLDVHLMAGGPYYELCQSCFQIVKAFLERACKKPT